MSGTWPRRMMNTKLVMKISVDTARMRSVLYLLFCMPAQERMHIRRTPYAHTVVPPRHAHQSRQ